MIMTDVKHNGKPVQSRLAHLVSAKVESGDATLLPPNIELELIGSYLPYKNSSGEREKGDPHYAWPIARFMGEISYNDLSLRHIWTIIYVLCNLLPGEKSIHLIVPKPYAQMQCFQLLNRIRLALGPEEDGYFLWRYKPYQKFTGEGSEPHFGYTVDVPAFWQGYGPFFAGSWVPDYYSSPMFSSAYEFLRSHFPAEINYDGEGSPGKLDESQKKTLTVPLYRRYDPELRGILSFRLADPFSESDFQLYQRWSTEYFFKKDWFTDALKGSNPVDDETFFSETDLWFDWILRICSPDDFLLLAECDGVPFACAQVHDGRFLWNLRNDDLLRNAFAFHIVIGEEEFMGDKWYHSAIQSLGHLLFLLDDGRDLLFSTPSVYSSGLLKHLCA